MKKLTIGLLTPLLIWSCATQYNVKGTSSVPALDGSKLYLKVMQQDDMVAIDSCEVVHGEFHFAGLLDSVKMASITMGQEGLIPVVLEQGDIQVSINQPTMRIGGTPLNDTLYRFMQQHTQLESSMAELGRKESQMLLDGIDEQTIAELLTREAAVLTRQEDSLVTHFICDNFDNVLGPGVFMMLTANLRYPVLTPQIEEILSKATQHFRQNQYVREYIRMAEENEAKMQGLDAPLPPPPPDTNTDTGR